MMDRIAFGDFDAKVEALEILEANANAGVKVSGKSEDVLRQYLKVLEDLVPPAGR